jgi:hypothetical protein
LLYTREKRAVSRLRGHLQHIPFNVEFPAVIKASQAALLITPVEKRCAPMGAKLTQDANSPLRVAENDQLLAEQARSDRRSIGFDFFGETGRNPMPPHELAHRGIPLDAAEQVVLLGRHGASPGKAALRMRHRILS